MANDERAFGVSGVGYGAAEVYFFRKDEKMKR
jgi:hypothetical protein